MLLKKKLTFKNILRVYKFFGGCSVKEKRRHQSAVSSGKGIGERVGKKQRSNLRHAQGKQSRPAACQFPARKFSGKHPLSDRLRENNIKTFFE